jgi:hypothetical protein
MMKTRWLVVASGTLAFGGGMAVRSAYPQNPVPPKVIVLDFMKVAPGSDAKYLELEQKVWKPFHQARLKAGNGRSWALYSMSFPAGSAMDRNYATISVFDNLEDYAKYEQTAARYFAEVHPKKPMDQIFADTIAARDHRMRELWIEVDRADRP